MTKFLFKKGHPYFPPTVKQTDDERAVNKIKKALRIQYGWCRYSKASKRWRYAASDLTPTQAAILDVRARAQYRRENLSPDDPDYEAKLVRLANLERQTDRSLYYGGAQP